MSGGPGLDVSGNVVGVNVAAYRSSQLVAFFVPAEHAVALLNRGTGAIMGGIGVSGLTAQEDEDIARLGLQTLGL